MNSWYVLTGGPCAGKTTLIMELAARGYHIVPEAARIYIEAGLAQGKTIEDVRGDELEFQRAVLRLKVKTEQGLSPAQLTFFDRGIHDSVAYFALHGIQYDAELAMATAAATYQKVFLLDVIGYTTDEVRTESPEQAQRVHELLGQVYTEAGIPVVRVPVLSVEERAEFIIQQVQVYA